MISAGTVLLQKYEISRVIGQGGMGVVALARHLQLQQPVAIKLLLPQVLDKHTVVQRFLREAQASVRLRSEHVCRVLDVGQLDNGAPYMVMEYLEGTDLDGLLRERGPLAAGEVVDFVLQACEALAEAHSLGIVHRDLKPANFFLTRRADGSPLVKVLDFGISKTLSPLEESLTTTQSVLGTPAYMSPEQLRSSKHVDARSDIWSLGVVLYELCSGSRPFSASSFSELVLKVAMEAPAALPAEVPAALAEVVLRCLAKEQSDRYADVAELVRALAPLARTQAVAQSAVERTARILSAAPAEGSAPALARAASLGGRIPGVGTAETEPAVPAAMPGAIPGGKREPRRAPSTMNAASGELVLKGARGPAEARRRRGLWLAGGVTVALAGAMVALLFVGAGRERAAAEDDAPPAAYGGASAGQPRAPAVEPARPATSPPPAAPSIVAPPLDSSSTPSSVPARAPAAVAPVGAAALEDDSAGATEATRAEKRKRKRRSAEPAVAKPATAATSPSVGDGAGAADDDGDLDSRQ